MEIPLPYGLYNGHLVTIDEVASGLDCHCLCPACNEKLIARKGFSMVHHFAHRANLDCNKGVEASLHILCIEMIAREKKISLPALLFGKSQQYEIFAETEIAVDSVKLQYIEDTLVPDIIIESRGHTLLLEITANQRVSPEKKQLLINHNMAGIEINITETLKDLIEINDYRLSSRAFRKELISNTTSKYWIHNPLLAKIETVLKKKHARLKTIGSFTTDGGNYFYVEDCPLENRVWQGGAKKGKAYASAEDCNQCDFCVARQGHPEGVYCVGHFTVNEFQQLLQKLKAL
jgi:hypothetical protein